MTITRRSFLGSALAVAGGLLAADGLLLEPQRFEVTEHDLSPGANAARRIVRFVQLSDLHLTGVTLLHMQIAAEIARRDPDFLVFTGDSVDGSYRLGNLQDFLELLPAELPKYFTLGNWEHWGRVSVRTLAQLVGQYSGSLLVNETVEFNAGADRLLVTGLDDFIGGTPSLDIALAHTEPAALHIALAHCPVQRDHIARRTAGADPSMRTEPTAIAGVDVSRYRISHVFSGHTHGGQVSLAGWRPYLPEGSGDYVGGWYRGDGPALYVSRGIGTSVLPVRFGSSPEIAVFSIAV